MSAFLDGLISHGLFYPQGVKGLYGRGAAFEQVLNGLNRLIETTTLEDKAEQMHFPPVIPRKLLEKSGFLNSFPHLAGTISAFEGTDAQHRQMQEVVQKGEDWSQFQKMTDVALASAACYPVYPTCAGVLPANGRLITVMSYCFRHEPSDDPARMQMFRMKEFIRLGTPETVLAWRQAWIQRGSQLLNSLGLPVDAVPASDPFFGRVGKMLATNQREQGLKFEVVVPIDSPENPTAIMSFNYHQDHFSSKFGIQTASDTLAHTACLGFGMERIVLALFKTHGFVPAQWPESVRGKLLS